MPYSTRARGGGQTGTNPRPRQNQAPTHGSDSESDLNIESEEDNDEDDEEEELDPPTTGKRKKQTRKAPVTLPTIHNYHELGLEWGQARADRILARQPHIKTHVPPNALFEAQAIQAQYNLDKTMLCIAEGVSRTTLDAALKEGPLAREPNKYTNYQAYSTVSTTTPMPPKGQSAGFKERNKIVGNAWSNYSDDEKHIFTPTLFEKLIREAMRERHLEPPAPTPSDEPTELDTSEILTTEEKGKYIPIFNRLVNMKPVTRDFKHGQLCRHSRKVNILEKVGIQEIGKVVEQLRIIHTKFRFQFHLLVAAWNPNTSMSRALYQDEFTSCEQWAIHARADLHLLERFALESTQAPAGKKDKKKKSVQYTHQASLRKDLITRLNGLVVAHLPGGRLIKTDTHPQTPDPHVTLKTRTYRGDIKLAILRTSDSKVDDVMLSRGAAAGRLSDEKVALWIEDIEAKRYLVVKADDPRLNPQTNSGDISTNLI